MSRNALHSDAGQAFEVNVQRLRALREEGKEDESLAKEEGVKRLYILEAALKHIVLPFNITPRCGLFMCARSLSVYGACGYTGPNLVCSDSRDRSNSIDENGSGIYESQTA
jgi:hypothetical protein